MSKQHKLTIEVTYTGSIPGATDAARRALDNGALQDAMLRYAEVAANSWSFRIVNVEVKP